MLVEGITLVFIVFVLCVAVVQGGGKTNCPSRIEMTKAMIRQLESEVELFKVEHSRYPKSLLDLVRHPAYVDARKWISGGYLPEEPFDGWVRPFLYRVPGLRGPFDIVSWGEDGQPGGEGVDADLWSHSLWSQ
jgi:general secretion pathway protein G